MQVTNNDSFLLVKPISAYIHYLLHLDYCPIFVIRYRNCKESCMSLFVLPLFVDVNFCISSLSLNNFCKSKVKTGCKASACETAYVKLVQ